MSGHSRLCSWLTIVGICSAKFVLRTGSTLSFMNGERSCSGHDLASQAFRTGTPSNPERETEGRTLLEKVTQKRGAVLPPLHPMGGTAMRSLEKNSNRRKIWEPRGPSQSPAACQLPGKEGKREGKSSLELPGPERGELPLPVGH